MVYEYKRKPLDDSEIDELLNACESFKEKFLVTCLLDGGLRVSELSGLSQKQIKWQQGAIEIVGKGQKRRVVPIPSNRMREVLERYFAAHEEVDISSRSIERKIKEIASRTSVSKKVSPHVLRHTYAINCVNKGINLRALQEAMGHSSLITTENYLNYSGKQTVEEFKRKW